MIRPLFCVRERPGMIEGRSGSRGASNCDEVSSTSLLTPYTVILDVRPLLTPLPLAVAVAAVYVYNSVLICPYEYLMMLEYLLQRSTSPTGVQQHRCHLTTTDGQTNQRYPMAVRVVSAVHCKYICHGSTIYSYCYTRVHIHCSVFFHPP